MLYRDAIGLLEYWEAFPPTHVLVRHALGYRGSTRSVAPSREELEALVSAYGRIG